MLTRDNYDYETNNDDTTSEPIETEVQIKERQHKENASNCIADGLSAADCLANGHSIRDAVGAGYNLKEFSVSDLKGDFSLGELKDSFSLGELKSEYSLHELKDNYSIGDLMHEFNLHDLKNEFQLHDLKAHFELRDLKSEFALGDLKDHYKVRELNSEFSLREISQELSLSKIKAENYTAKDLKLAGFSAHELYNTYTAAEMRGNFSAEQIGMSQLGHGMNINNKSDIQNSNSLSNYKIINQKYSDLKKLEGNKTFTNANGDHECVEFVRQTTNAPSSKTWSPEDKRVLDMPAGTIEPGTAIATFGKDGKYNGHAAIYLRHDKDGIVVLDQWNEQGQVIERKIKIKDGYVSNDARNFFIIKKK